jgi:hypothetical protein
MRYASEMASGAVTHILNFMKISSGIQPLQTHKHQDDLIRGFLFFQNEINMLKMNLKT